MTESEYKGKLEYVPGSCETLPTDIVKKLEHSTLRGQPLPRLDEKPSKMGMKHTHRKTSRR